MKRQKEEEEGPYKYVVYALLKVLNNQRTQYLWTNKISGLHTKGNFDSGLFNIEIDKAIVEKNLTDIADIQGWVKSTHGRATRRHFTLKDLSIDEWEARVESLSTEEWKRYTGYVLDINVAITARNGAGLRRPIQDVDSPAQSPSHRRTRTDALEQTHAVVRDRNERLGDYSEKLITRWKCRNTTYKNKGVCWIDNSGQHHQLNTLHRERWASAMASGSATEHEPPLLLAQSLMGQEGEKLTKKKSAMEEMKEVLAQQLEFDTIRSMRSMINESRQ